MRNRNDKLSKGTTIFNFIWPDLALQIVGVAFNALLFVFRAMFRIKWFNPSVVEFQDFLLWVSMAAIILVFLIGMQYGRYHTSLDRGSVARYRSGNEEDGDYVPWHERVRSPNPWLPIRFAYNAILVTLFWYMLTHTPYDLGV